jgi:thioredoxin reductase/Pyruvate/2-oxoacid:ferredoxin oxidoreductase delta subunit
MDAVTAGIVAATAAGAVALGARHVSRRRARQQRDEAVLREKIAGGANHARSLHPVIDPDVCIGSLSCLGACPEGDILGMVRGTAHLVHADHCIGHGRCAAECPVGAIRLVFGSAERGVDLPEVDASFESSRPGVHVVGELGGMGLIKNAIVQGLEVAERLAERTRAGAAPVVIVGAGPAGLATALGLKARGVPHRLLEQGALGGAIVHYPRRKVAMTETVQLPLFGRFGRRQISKEELLDTWRRVVAKADLEVHQGVKVTGVQGADGRFTVETEKGSLAASKVVLAIGRRGTPRKLGVPGEEQEKVVYGLVDPEQYAGARTLVVGGGDAALEAAIQLAEESNAAVAISYRGPEFARCRDANRRKVDALVRGGRVKAYLPSHVREVRPGEVVLEAGGRTRALPNDFVIVNVGGELPLEFLAKAGVSMRRHHGEAPGAHPHPHPQARSGAGRTARPPESAERARRPASRLLYLLTGFSILAFLAWVGRDYYPLDRAERLGSDLHPFLKSAGPWGHGVGIAATLFMLSNFLYPLRKRWKRLDRLGGIRGWLDFHVFVGFMSPLVIAFHAAFQSNNHLATWTSAALAVVVATGIVGRYIYSVVPSERGKSAELADLLASFERLRDALAGSRTAGGARRLVEHVTAPVQAGSFALLFVALPAEALAIRLRLLLLPSFGDRRIRRAFRRDVLTLSRLRWQIRFFASLKRLLRGWRVFHATLAAFLVLTIAAHIGVSLYLGYGLLRR